MIMWMFCKKKKKKKKRVVTAGDSKKRIHTTANSGGLEFDATFQHWQIRTSNKPSNRRA
jgi:hypothetical protein